MRDGASGAGRRSRAYTNRQHAGMQEYPRQLPASSTVFVLLMACNECCVLFVNHVFPGRMVDHVSPDRLARLARHAV